MRSFKVFAGMALLACLLISPAFAATGYQDPTADVGKQTWGSRVGGSGSHSSCINQAPVRQPTVPSVLQYITTGNVQSGTDTIAMGPAPTISGTVSSVTLWIYVLNTTTTGGGSVSIAVNEGGLFLTSQSVSAESAGTWVSTTFTATFSQADLNNLQMQIVNVAGTTGSTTIYDAYATYTYTAVASPVVPPATTVTAVQPTGTLLHVVVDTAPTTAVSATALPLPTGAATAALQPGFGTAGTPNANVASFQGVSGGTPAPVSATALPLPTGAATAALQPGFGTAGSASAQVVTVQGVASMTKLLVTPDSVALPANQSVNVAQFNGVTTTMGNGVTGTGVQRVTISSDSTGQVAIAAGAATIGALTPNQSVNTAQVNGVTTLTGAGATGTGAQRVTTSQDTTTIAGSAPGTAGSASAQVVTVQGVASMTPVQTSLINVGATAVVTGGVNGSIGVGGNQPASASATGNPLQDGVDGQTAFPSAGTTGHPIYLFGDKYGRMIDGQSAPVDLWVSGAVVITASTSSTSIIGAPGAGKIYLTSCFAHNTGSSTTLVTYQNGSGGSAIAYGIAPAGGGCNENFVPPLASMSATTGLYAAGATSTTSLYITCDGFTGP